MMRSSPAPAISIPATIILNRLHLWPLWPSMNQATAVQTPAISRSRKATSATVTLVLCEKARRGFTQATVLSRDDGPDRCNASCRRVRWTHAWLGLGGCTSS